VHPFSFVVFLAFNRIDRMSRIKPFSIAGVLARRNRNDKIAIEKFPFMVRLFSRPFIGKWVFKEN